MNWHLVTFANDKFHSKQEYLNMLHKDNFILHPYNRAWLETTDFYQENKDLLDQETGSGWWSWKPYIIQESMKNSKEGDYIVYCDCGDMFSPGLQFYVEQTLTEEDICFLLLGNNNNGKYTKRDCFILMNCNEEDYWNSNQLEAGFMIWKVCDKSKKVIQDWLEFCTNSQIINNDPSSLGEELNGFVAHRNDQSILTNLAIRDGLTVGGYELRNYIECDYDYWYERGLRSSNREVESFLNTIKNA